MALGTITLEPTAENIAAAGLLTGYADKRVVNLANPRPRARRFVRLQYDAAGVPFVRDRLYGRRDIVGVRFLVIDGERLKCGSVVLASV